MSTTYRGNPVLWAARARADERHAADLADAEANLAAAEARAAEEIPEAIVRNLADAGIVVPVRRRSSKAEPAASKE